jgi:hypothetical protein
MPAARLIMRYSVRMNRADAVVQDVLLALAVIIILCAVIAVARDFVGI